MPAECRTRPRLGSPGCSCCAQIRAPPARPLDDGVLCLGRARAPARGPAAAPSFPPSCSRSPTTGCWCGAAEREGVGEKWLRVSEEAAAAGFVHPISALGRQIRLDGQDWPGQVGPGGRAPPRPRGPFRPLGRIVRPGPFSHGIAFPFFFRILN